MIQRWIERERCEHIRMEIGIGIGFCGWQKDVIWIYEKREETKSTIHFCRGLLSLSNRIFFLMKIFCPYWNFVSSGYASDFWCQIFHLIQLIGASTFDCNQFPKFGCKSRKNCFWNHFLIVSALNLGKLLTSSSADLYLECETRELLRIRMQNSHVIMRELRISRLIDELQNTIEA